MHIVCFTGTRADYGILRPALRELDQDPRFCLELVVTGMHLLPEYGETIREIEKDVFAVIATPSILLKGDSLEAMSKSAGLGILYFSDILQRSKPDCVLLLGDRIEILSAAIAAHYQNIGIVHLHGGEQSGSADDAVRHAISKFAHLHFVASLKAKQHLLRLGEADWRIVPIGSLRKQQIERIRNLKDATACLWSEAFGIHSPRSKILLCIHPDSKDPLNYEEQINSVLNALRPYACESDIYVIGPNSDSGGSLFREKLLAFVNEHPLARYIPSIPDDQFLFLMSNVDLMIGNSSSAIIESPFFHLTAINIGNRQQGRESADNVISIPFDTVAIQQAIHLQLNTKDSLQCANPYDLCENPEREFIEQLARFASRLDIWEKSP
ncbi:UDP-N-acetylglucosamine 2-epimerase (hydrolyzing) [Paenibacillus sp. SYP-B3998]|uniref:UDP-N-acetylglucosamine 2-epimerase (Hydrolyzing) n=1 Tax=Paenibacillus sp. SYP-B3998 TaxID=2678564 RepID=A0A6G4A2F8_9BACL|nr:UDP-N-acetylglucosamine 2-epimerase [Paenibacillus sp. SYP-B3998]NEW08510.1 UDP-N-acetylglucosamine 2-epimerase (hydrolyzing) [Paenibacillus sp. SYP-B3998]